MVWSYLFGGEPQLPPGPTRLPDYFPVQPKGCERHAETLFACISKEATEKARDKEKLGYYTSYNDKDRTKQNLPESAVAKDNQSNDHTMKVDNVAVQGTDVAKDLPSPDENPLDVCRKALAHYQKCCDRELKKKKNWILTDSYRVQEEYRYQQQKQGK
jgi:hypothetical protein